MMCRFFSSPATVDESRALRRRATTRRRREISMSYVCAGDSLPVGLLASVTVAGAVAAAGARFTVTGWVVPVVAVGFAMLVSTVGDDCVATGACAVIVATTGF